MLSTSALKPQLQFLDKNPQKQRKFGDERIIEKLDFLEYQYQHKESVGGIELLGISKNKRNFNLNEKSDI